MKPVIIASCLAFLLAACSNVKELSILSSPIENRIIHPDKPKPVSLDRIKFKVINNTNIDTFIAEQKLKSGKNDIVFIAMSMDDYEKLSLNFAELKRYIQQQGEIIVYYRKMTGYTSSDPK
jgi:hypothetical protein